MMYFINSIILSLIQLILILISIAFVTLMERKTLSSLQIRKGPNKVALIGLIQPFSDAIKLFLKENILLKNFNYMMYLISPIMSMSLMLILWMNSNSFYILNSKLNILIILCLLSMNVYPMMIMGWSSNSMYSMLGSIRSIAQTISYEVTMIIIIMSNLIFTESFNIMDLYQHQQGWGTFGMFMWWNNQIFFFILLAELNRTPYDLAEGESELVSGFNTEYMSGSFALIFLAEYGMIIFMMYFHSILFMMWTSNNNIFFYIQILSYIWWVIHTRATYPRYRYDEMMMMHWKEILPMALNILLFYYIIKWLFILWN